MVKQHTQQDVQKSCVPLRVSPPTRKQHREKTESPTSGTTRLREKAPTDWSVLSRSHFAKKKGCHHENPDNNALYISAFCRMQLFEPTAAPKWRERQRAGRDKET
jgi:hypothetical protein